MNGLLGVFNYFRFALCLYSHSQCFIKAAFLELNSNFVELSCFEISNNTN